MATFSKAERLCSRSVIDKLYLSGNRLMVYPLSVHWMERPPSETAARLQVLLAAPKKKLHHAVDRNRTKRILRECWRSHKEPLVELLQQQGRAMAVGINYVDNHVATTPLVLRSFDKLSEKLAALWAPQTDTEADQ
ncbi:MAG: ribonuclease P protein component [Bacteroidales bacterium]|nr:ribonuclease P protein component [Bacteroidales bacterium]